MNTEERQLAGRSRFLLDDATRRIGSETAQRVQEAPAELRGHVTVIAIAGCRRSAADRIVVRNHGRVAERGTHDARMAADGGTCRTLYLLQQIGE